MCGRYVLNQIVREWARSRLGAIALTGDMAWVRYNVAPSARAEGTPPALIPVIRVTTDGSQLEIVPMVWAFVPSFVNEENPPKQPINARAETVGTNGYFRQSFQHRRCLIPVLGFYEWAEPPQAKEPYFISSADDSPFCLAGIWDHWHGYDRVAIIVGPPNELIARFHHRMAMAVSADYAESWLGGPAEVPPVYPAELMKAHRVSTLVNKPAIDDPDLILPLGTPSSVTNKDTTWT